jgi:acetyl-CoA C-acetyltransferase
MHAIAETVQRARQAPGSFGFVGANGGYLSKYSAGVYSTRPAAWVPDRSAALQAEVSAWDAPPQARHADGPAVIESFTVTHARDGAAAGVVIGRLEAGGERFAARGADGDRELLDLLITAGQPIGQRVGVRSGESGNLVTATA